MTVLAFHVRTADDAHDPTAIRRAVAAARRICPEADLEGIAESAIEAATPTRAVKATLFDLIAEALASRPAGEITFRRAPLAAIVGAARRS